MRYVLDCSVATKWFVPEPGSDIAERVLIDQQSGRLSFVAPDILVPELAGVLTKHVARGTVNIEAARLRARRVSFHAHRVGLFRDAGAGGLRPRD